MFLIQVNKEIKNPVSKMPLEPLASVLDELVCVLVQSGDQQLISKETLSVPRLCQNYVINDPLVNQHLDYCCDYVPIFKTRLYFQHPRQP
jgi:hypothetical protein